MRKYLAIVNPEKMDEKNLEKLFAIVADNPENLEIRAIITKHDSAQLKKCVESAMFDFLYIEDKQVAANYLGKYCYSKSFEVFTGLEGLATVEKKTRCMGCCMLEKLPCNLTEDYLMSLLPDLRIS